MRTTWPLLVLFTLLPSFAANTAAQEQPARLPWGNVSDLQLISDERDSLKGVSRLALSVNVPDTLADRLPAASLSSTIAFRLEQAGLVVVPTRAVEEPLLVITLRAIDDQATRGAAARLVYRVYADLLQLVRLSDQGSAARLMMASTWHAGSFGTIPASDPDELRERVAEVVDAFLADLRFANPSTPSESR